MHTVVNDQILMWQLFVRIIINNNNYSCYLAPMDNKISKDQLKHNLLYGEQAAPQKMTQMSENTKIRGASQSLSTSFIGKALTVFGDENHDEKDDAGMLPGTEYDRTRYLVNHEKSSSKDFMDEVTYKVPVKDLYEVMKVCTSHQGCNYQALLLEIKNEELKDIYKGSHLLQVRNKSGELVFQRTLYGPEKADSLSEDDNIDPIHAWNIFQTHFVYMLSTQMQQKDYQYIYVIDLRGAEDNQVLKEVRIVNTFIDELSVYNHIGFFQQRELVISATDSFRHLDVGALLYGRHPDESGGHIWTVEVPHQAFNETKFTDVNVKVIFPTVDLKGLRISPQCVLKKILDLGDHRMALVFENDENQLAFYELKFNAVEGIHLIQLQDAAQRMQGIRKKWQKGDSITKLSNILYWESALKKYVHCGIALRKSGSLDFYYNFRLVEETCETLQKATMDLDNTQEAEFRKEKGCIFANVYADYGQLYFTDSHNIYKCSMAWQEHIGINQSEIIVLESKLDISKATRQVWGRVLKSRVSATARLFPCFMLFFTKLLVAHSNIISVFDCITGTWSKPKDRILLNNSGNAKKPKMHHFLFEAPVVSIFRSKMDHGTGAYEIGVILANNTIRCLVGLESNSSDVKIELSGSYIQLPGGIEHLCYDTELKENGKSVFLLLDKTKRYNRRATEINTSMIGANNQQTNMKKASFGSVKKDNQRWSQLPGLTTGNQVSTLQMPLGMIKEGSDSESSDENEKANNKSDEEVHSDSGDDVDEGKIDPFDISQIKLNSDNGKQTKMMGEILREKVWKVAKEMNQQPGGDKGFYNIKKSLQRATISSANGLRSQRTLKSHRQDETFSLLNDEKVQNTGQIYAIMQGQLSKIKGIPNLPRNTSISLEFDCKLDSKSPTSGFLYIDNQERRILAVYKLVKTMANTKQGYYASLVSKNLAYGTAKENTAQKREIQAILGPQIEGAFMSESERAKIKKTEKNKYRRMLITNGDFHQYDDEGIHIDTIWKGRNIRSAIQVDKLWTYTISDERQSWDNAKKKPDKSKELTAGLYLYDYQRLMHSGDIEVYKIRDAMGGVNCHQDFSYFMQRISFVADLDYIEIVPIPSRNVINFFGMRPRNDYMIWHHNKKSGEFTAVDKTGLLIKWSTTTGLIVNYQKSSPNIGKIVVPKVFDFQGEQRRSKKDRWEKEKEEPIYKVFKGDKNDFTYFKGWQHRGCHTIQLLVHKDPIKRFLQPKKTQNIVIDGILGESIAKVFRKMITYELQKLGKSFEYRKFLLIKLHSESNSANEWIESIFEFEHVYYPSFTEPDNSGVCQRIYFNEDLTKMMERRKDSVCIIYERNDATNVESNVKKGLGIRLGQAMGIDTSEVVGVNKVQWQVWRTVQRYPSLLSGVTSFPFLFSPDFSYYIDIDYQGDSFIVRDVKKNGSIEHVIPSGLMSLSLKGSSKSKKALPRLAKLIGFYDNKHLKVVDKGGVESIYNFRKGGIRQRLMSAASIDNFVVNSFHFNHIIHETDAESPSETLDRLMRIADQTKVLQHELRKMVWNPLTDGMNEKKKRQIIEAQYAHLFAVDFNAISDDPDLPAFFTTELSFTFLDFQILERILQDRNFDLSHIDEQSKIQQCFNIYPGIDTTFHKLAQTNHTNFDADSISKLYMAAENLNQDPDLRHRYILPMIEDMHFQTPLDLIFQGNVDVNFAWQFLYNIKDYPFLHSGHMINRIIPKAIKENIPDLDVFMDCRLKPSTHLQSHFLAKQALITKSKNKVKDYFYDVTLGEAWEDKNNLVDRLFDAELFKKPMSISYFDLPELHLNNEIGFQFWKALGETPEFDLFDKKAIQILINYKWRGFQPEIIKRFVIPYLLFILTFTLWSNLFYQNRNTGYYFFGNQIICYMLIVWSIYFIWVEFQQMKARGCKYFQDYINYVDMIPLILMISMTSWTIVDAFLVKAHSIHTQSYEILVIRDYIQSMNAILMWYKFAYFLRVTNETGWLIRMISQVVIDLGPFLLVLMISILAFTDAFSSMSISQVTTATGKGDDPEKAKIVEGYGKAIIYSYFILIGQFDTDVFLYNGAIICWIYFLLATFFNLIVMLNLLIAIISETYTRLQEQKTQLAYQTKATIISDYLYLDVGKHQEIQRNETDRMLIVAMESEKRQADTEKTQLSDVMRELRGIREKISNDINDVKTQVQNIRQQENLLDEFSYDSDKEKH